MYKVSSMATASSAGFYIQTPTTFQFT